MLCYVTILCYVMLCYVMLCYVMVYNIMKLWKPTVRPARSCPSIYLSIHLSIYLSIMETDRSKARPKLPTAVDFRNHGNLWKPSKLWKPMEIIEIMEIVVD